METAMSLNWVDYAVILLYFFFVFAVGHIVSKNVKGDQDYFLAGRNLGWFLVGSSIFASNIGSEHLIGLAGTGAKSGLAVAQFEILACLILILLGWFFTPYYLKTKINTVPEFLEKRFSPKARNYLTLISIFSYVVSKISVTIYAGAIVFSSLGIPFWTGAILVVVITGLYTVIGGLLAVIYTDMVQMIIMIVGAIIISILGLYHLGGIQELSNAVPESYFSLWRPWNDPEFPWPGILFGAPILAIWYWCTDQFIVQRVLAAKGLPAARRGSIFAGYLKLLPLFIFVFPGVIALALHNKGALVLANHDSALISLSQYVLPIGFRGIFIAGMLAALMSSLSSVFNSCSTLITYDVYQRYFPKASSQKLMQVGKYFTFALVIIGLLWIPMMKYISGTLYQYIQSIQAYISPPITAVFLLGLLFPRANTKGALSALYTGLVLGILRIILEINKEHLSGIFYTFANINFLYFALILFILSCLIIWALADPVKSHKRNALLYDWKELKKVHHDKTYPVDLALSLILIGIVLSLWAIYS